MRGMTVIVKTVTRWVIAFIVLYGIYSTLTGHLTAGGGFAGGAILTCAFILLTLAYGKEYALSKLSRKANLTFISVGALLFLVTALAGMMVSGVFFDNFLRKFFPGEDFTLLSSGTILTNDMTIFLQVGVPLFFVFIVLSEIRIVTRRDGTKKMIQEEEEE